MRVPAPTLVSEEEPERTRLELSVTSPLPNVAGTPGPKTSEPAPLKEVSCAPFCRITVAPAAAESEEPAGSALAPLMMRVPARTVVAPV